ncbi:MAG: hypothetical protein QOF76_2728, partial [Solirubrobacteraceae bacterium]|nr:hypothetical protein [Solirubrobacteraceae bacterium]
MTLIASPVVIAKVQPLTTTRRIDGPFDYLVGDADVAVGSVVKVRFGHQALDGVVVGLAAASDVEPEKLVALSSVSGSIPAELVDLAEWMGEEYCSTFARALALLTPPAGKARTELWARATGVEDGKRLTDGQRAVLERLPGPSGEDLPVLRRLEARGLVAIEPRVRRRVPFSHDLADRAVSLTQEQREVLAALEADPGGRHLLHGVTGSGKTEVYLQAAARTLAAGRGVIILVPEIALTPQTVGRFQARFGDTVALLHSSLSDGERFDEWTRLRRGEARVAVGPRSAVFAPMSDIGLIVIDEEHEASYKHEGDPRYDARLVARWRAAYHGAGLLCGTATPRPETWRELPHLTLAHRVDGAGLPPVVVVDMKGSHHPLHPDTQRALSEVAAAGEKAIVL